MLEADTSYFRNFRTTVVPPANRANAMAASSPPPLLLPLLLELLVEFVEVLVVLFVSLEAVPLAPVPLPLVEGLLMLPLELPPWSVPVEPLVVAEPVAPPLVLGEALLEPVWPADPVEEPEF